MTHRSADEQRAGPVAAGARSVAAERIDGVVVTGDGAAVSVVIAGAAGFCFEVLGVVDDDQEEALRSPSYLLDARRRVVPYRPRPVEQEALIAWRDGKARASVLLVHGPGGQGKTRLAGWLATHSHRRGWTVTQAVDQDAPPGSSAAVGQPEERSPLLVVVDYAERWPVRLLVRMIQTVVAARRRVRVLLLARPVAGFWDGVEPELERCSVDLVEPMALGGFTSPQERAVVFAQAVQAFQKALQVPVSPVALPEGVLGGSDSPLTLHMAALAAVTAAEQGERMPAAGELSRYLRNHERRHWRAVGLPAETIATMVLIAAVFGPAESTRQGRAWLRRACLADTDTQAVALLQAYERLYPAAVAQPKHDQGVLWPIKPDRFAEDFIGDQLTRPDCAELLGELLTDEQTPPAAVRHGLIMLAAAARHSSVQAVLFPLLRERAVFARYLTPPLIEAVIGYADMATAQVVDQRMPRFSTDLLRPARDLARHLMSALPADASPALRAYRLARLGIRLSEVGDKRAALEPAREAVGIYRTLAEAEPAAYLPHLASALSNLGRHLSEVGDRRAAPESTREAVGIYRRLAEAEPAVYLPNLAMSLNNLGVHLSEAKDKRAALEPAREAVGIYRRLAEAEPAVYLPNLAMSLNNLGLRLSEVRDKRAALEFAREAVGIYRRLAEAEPAVYLPDFAMSLWSSAWIRNANAIELREAVTAVDEAIAIYRTLAEQIPEAFNGYLALVERTRVELIDQIDSAS
jgi:tetratricopeptide (TPR) repeat protein